MRFALRLCYTLGSSLYLVIPYENPEGVGCERYELPPVCVRLPHCYQASKVGVFERTKFDRVADDGFEQGVD